MFSASRRAALRFDRSPSTLGHRVGTNTPRLASSWRERPTSSTKRGVHVRPIGHLDVQGVQLAQRVVQEPEVALVPLPNEAVVDGPQQVVRQRRHPARGHAVESVVIRAGLFEELSRRPLEAPENEPHPPMRLVGRERGVERLGLGISLAGGLGPRRQIAAVGHAEELPALYTEVEPLNMHAQQRKWAVAPLAQAVEIEVLKGSLGPGLA